jgi:hypothetical protein
MVRWSRAVGSLLLAASLLIGPTQTSTASAVLSPGATQTSAAARPATDYVAMDSDPSHWVGRGERRVWQGDEITVEPYGEGGVTVNMWRGARDDLHDDFQVTIQPVPGQKLEVGSYDHVRFPGTDHRGLEYAGFDLNGDGRGCNVSMGRMRILDVSPDLTRLWLVYEDRCSYLEDQGQIWGEIRIGVPDPPEQAVVLPEEREMPEQYPGLAAEPHRGARLFNTSSTPVVVAGAAITSGAPEFSLVANRCGTIAVRSSCAVEVGFQPLLAGTRQGELTFYSTAGTHVVRLSGLGIPGHNAFEVRAEPGPTYPGGGSWSFTPYNATLGKVQPGAAWSVNVSARNDALGFEFQIRQSSEPYQEGRTYVDDGDGRGVDISMIYGGRQCDGVGQFTVDEVVLAPDGFTLQTFAGTYEHYCGEWVTGSFAYRADAVPAPPAFPTSPPDPPVDPGVLSLTTDRMSYTAGDRVTVTAALSKGTGQEITIQAIVGDRPGQILTTQQVDSQGRVVLSGRITRNTTFIATSDDLQANAGVRVAASIQTRALASIRRKGTYAVFRRSGRVRAAVAPAHPQDCLGVVVERRRAGAWQRTRTDQCIRLGLSSLADVRVTGARHERQRVLFFWAGDADNSAAVGRWTYVTFVGPRR